MKVVKHADKLVPLKSWNVRNALATLGMSLDHIFNFVNIKYHEL